MEMLLNVADRFSALAVIADVPGVGVRVELAVLAPRGSDVGEDLLEHPPRFEAIDTQQYRRGAFAEHRGLPGHQDAESLLLVVERSHLLAQLVVRDLCCKVAWDL